MALTIATMFLSPRAGVFDVTATLDADTTTTFNPGLGGGQSAVPLSKSDLGWEVHLTPLLSQGLTALSAWVRDNALGSSLLTLTKLASVGSGNAAKQLRVVVKVPDLLGI